MSSSPLSNIRIVLSHTSHAGNIGATARAMKTMGLQSLYLVNPRSFPDKEADIRAVSARDLLNKARVCNNMDEALQGTVFAAALTARPRELAHETFHAREGARLLLEQAKQHPVALVFGAETSGLTSEEVNKCQATIVIPTNPDYASLNLANAAQIMAYELRMAIASVQPPAQFLDKPAALNDIELFYEHLEQVMIQIDFLDPQKPKKLMQRIRRLFSRTRLEQQEIHILRGILNAVEKQVKKR